MKKKLKYFTNNSYKCSFTSHLQPNYCDSINQQLNIYNMRKFSSGERPNNLGEFNAVKSKTRLITIGEFMEFMDSRNVKSRYSYIGYWCFIDYVNDFLAEETEEGYWLWITVRGAMNKLIDLRGDLESIGNFEQTDVVYVDYDTNNMLRMFLTECPHLRFIFFLLSMDLSSNTSALSDILEFINNNIKTKWLKVNKFPNNPGEFISFNQEKRLITVNEFVDFANSINIESKCSYAGYWCFIDHVNDLLVEETEESYLLWGTVKGAMNKLIDLRGDLKSIENMELTEVVNLDDDTIDMIRIFSTKCPHLYFTFVLLATELRNNTSFLSEILKFIDNNIQKKLK